MNYEKSHNLLLHTIHYSLKKLNMLYSMEKTFIMQQENKYFGLVDNYLDNPCEELPRPYEGFTYSWKGLDADARLEWKSEVNKLLDILYPVLSIARQNFPTFKYLFDWIEQSKPDGEMNLDMCWCLGCKGNRLIQFEERPSLGIAPAMVPLGNGVNVPPTDFKLAEDHIKEEDDREEANFQKYLHDEVCSMNGNPCCNPCKKKNDIEEQDRLQQVWREDRAKEMNDTNLERNTGTEQ